MYEDRAYMWDMWRGAQENTTEAGAGGGTPGGVYRGKREDIGPSEVVMARRAGGK